jgi:hypothetical protein
VQHAAAANLISFQRERDLVPLIVANCNYSFSVGKSVSMEYDFDQLEKQVEERFIRGRSRLLPRVCLLMTKTLYMFALSSSILLALNLSVE